MKYTELKNSIKEGAASVYLLEGDDAYFRKNGELLIKDAFLQMPELNFTSFDGENLKGSAFSDLITAVKNYPFMAEKRIIKVTEFYPSESEYETHLKPLFDDFPPTSILIIVNIGGKKGVDLKRKKSVTYVDCNRSDEETVAKWAYLTFRKAGINASAAACANIAAYCLCNMSRVALEVQKLIDYKGSGTLSESEVEELVYKDAEYRLYELTNTISGKNYTKFCLIADELLRKGFDEINILNSLFNYFKNLLTILNSDDSDGELAVVLKMKEYGVKKSREQARAIGNDRLVYLVKKTYGAISDIKCGRTMPPGALQIVENSIFFGQAEN